MQQVHTDLCDPAAKILLLGDEQIDIRLPAQGSLEFFRFAECGRTAARHPRSLAWFGKIRPKLYPPSGAATLCISGCSSEFCNPAAAPYRRKQSPAMAIHENLRFARRPSPKPPVRSREEFRAP
jgi:hypothetical protein